MDLYERLLESHIQGGEWQSNILVRLCHLGFGGFIFGPGVNWWVINIRGDKISGPFTSSGDLSAWVVHQENRPDSVQGGTP